MNIKILKIPKEQPEELEIRCHEETELVHEIVTFVASIQGRLTGILEGEQYEVPVSDILYVESVDNQTFIYSTSRVYGSRHKLYEIEGLLKEKWFLRVSKNLVVNLMKVQSIKPALNGRYYAILKSGEEIIISRKYVPDLKRALKGGN